MVEWKLTDSANWQMKWTSLGWRVERPPGGEVAADHAVAMEVENAAFGEAAEECLSDEGEDELDNNGGGNVDAEDAGADLAGEIG